ncbi:hypothetical protein [Streptomyces sp. NPDC048644]|uniref:hypothetical protein n=1 Tax=Streptomyces sp. NPDC048644 TaxID=3365582 RepID=UPI003718FE97
MVARPPADRQDSGPTFTVLLRGARRVAAHNPYWDTWGVTLEAPDGYRLVLCRRAWAPA